ncbi:MAG: transcriptional regulator FtrA [Pseudomonadota bacterium]|nr:transcriptional regulator FtrA [Pseudomonadota bacterium]
MVNIPPNRRHLVAALAHEDLCTFEYGITAEIFGQQRPEMGEDWYDFLTVADRPGPLRALGGLTFQAERGIDALASADTIVIPGWTGVDVPVPHDLVDALVAAHSRGARIATICSGVFVLAATGLLDGKRATTHWRYAAVLEERHPAIIVDPHVLYVDEAPLFTSAGSSAGIDLLLHIVRCDHGAETANVLARRLIMAPHRQGGQAQFIERPVPRREGSRLAPLLDAMRAELGRNHRISDLANAVAMSERTFLRRFNEATGMSPGEWLTSERMELAKQLLETSEIAIEKVALASGFGTIATLRHHFRRRMSLSPRHYRARFRATHDAADGRH